jgi:hypothetical protein
MIYHHQRLHLQVLTEGGLRMADIALWFVLCIAFSIIANQDLFYLTTAMGAKIWLQQFP